MLRRPDWSLYGSLNTLGQKAGVAAEWIPHLVAKELADNALDVSRTCRVGFLADNGFWVEDDGPGISKNDNQIAALFSINRPLMSTKTFRKPSRGALGNGLRVVAGAVLSTNGRLVVATQARMLELIPQESTGKTIAKRLCEWTKPEGCRIEVRFGPSLRVRHDALEWANEAIALAAGGSSYEGESSPYWYDSDAFYDLLKFSGTLTVRKLITQLQGCAEPKAGRIAAAFKNRPASTLTRAEADQLLIEARRVAAPIKPSALGEIGRLPSLPPGYAKIIGIATIGSPRSAIKASLPVVVEAWAQTTKRTTARLFVNRTPITGELVAWKKRTLLCLSGCNADLEIPCGRQEIDLRINIQVPHMPITTDGKEPDLHQFGDFIERSVAKATKIARRNATAGLGVQETKKNLILKNLDAGIEKAGEGDLPFGQRQLFYVVRGPFVAERLEELDWDYFCQVITDYEYEHGPIPRMTRDPRGSIYHPHLGTEIPLGTLTVNDYERPPWLFKNVLYIEKEGFFPILKAVRWPEMNDCCLISSKGFSTRAVRDLIDYLAAMDEECNFFCMHDADASGTMIMQTIQDATKARGARKVKINNLGLEPAEARDMGLQVEKVPKKERNLRVANYVSQNDKLWLRTNRVELNSMTTRQFLEWLNRKFAPYAGKVIPPDGILRSRLQATLRNDLKERIIRAVLRRAKVEQRVERAVIKRAEALAASMESLPAAVRSALQKNMVQRWISPVDRIARSIITGTKPQT